MEKSVQETYAPQSICFGCGPANALGLRIRSFEQGENLVLSFTPQEQHAAFPGVMSGGIIGTLLDCHSNWTAAMHFMRKTGADQPAVTVTAEFDVKLRRPTPMGPVELRAHVVSATDDRAVVEAELEAGGKICATCTGTFVAVKPGHPAYHRW